MIWDANGIFTAYPEYFGKSMQRKIFAGENPFLSPIFKRIASKEEREKAWEDKPCMIISTSGMLNGGPILEHLGALAEDPKNTMIFVGYQAEGTLGRRIQKGWKEVPVKTENGKTVSVALNMEVYTAEGLSGHSDYKQLINYISRLSARPDKIVVVHGEPQKAVSFAKGVHKLFRIETVAPRNLEAIRLK
jgi:predicted metal-dependent RNase